MKTFTKILVVTLVFLSFSCSSDDDAGSNPISNNNFTAIVDGVDYEAQFVDGLIVVAGNISVSGSQGDGNNMVVTFPIDAVAGDVFTVESLEFIGSFDSSDGFAGVSNGGTITITAHNPEARTVSGTFNFVATSFEQNPTIVTITGGSFSTSYSEL